MARPLTAAEYRLLVVHSPVMIWRAGLDARCDYFNETWIEFTGRSLEQELGDGWAEGVHADDMSRCVEYYLDHFRRRAPFEMEYRLRRHDGVYRWIFDRGVPFYDDNGEFAGFIGSCVDVDDRRKTQEARQRHDEEQLALARDFERRILAIVSHDIRDPLNTIQLSTQHLFQVAGDPVTVKKDTQRITRAANRIQHIVGDLLDLSRERQGGGIPLAPAPADLRAICNQVIDELEMSASQPAFEFVCEADGAGSWDQHRIAQAIANLASNAVKHGTPGSPIRVRLTGDAQRVSVQVQNEGAIAPELLPGIFEAFRAGKTHAGRGGGLGLGLFIAKSIARAHGGTIDVDSSGGQTTFRLTLPRKATAEA